LSSVTSCSYGRITQGHIPVSYLIFLFGMKFFFGKKHTFLCDGGLAGHD